MRTFFSGLRALLLFMAYSFVSLFLLLVPAGKAARRRLLTGNTSFFSRHALAALGARITVHHRERLPSPGRGCLIVANHLSTLDILMLSALAPSVFVTSVEMKHTFFLGVLARCAGSLFVERRKPSGLKQEISAIADALRKGSSVVLFPEGTTTNGDCVLQFKNALFHAAVRAEADVLPLCIRYRRVNGEPVTRQNRERVFFYGGMPFFTHAFRIIGNRSLEAEIMIQPAVSSRAHPSRKLLAEQAYRAITGIYCREPFPRSR